MAKFVAVYRGEMTEPATDNSLGHSVDNARRWICICSFSWHSDLPILGRVSNGE